MAQYIRTSRVSFTQPLGELGARSTGTSHMGAIAELVVCADQMSKGNEVFRSASPASTHDLVIMTPDSHRPKSVQVRFNKRFSVQGVRVLSETGVESDILARVYPDEIVYYAKATDAMDVANARFQDILEKEEADREKVLGSCQ